MSSCLDTMLNLFIFLSTIGIIPVFMLEFHFRDPTIIFLPKITITIIVIGLVTWYFSSNENNDDDIDVDNNEGPQYDDNIYFNSSNNKKKTNYLKPKSYCYKTNTDTYDKITKINTLKEINKLYKTQKFKEMYEEKGDNPANWNWQIRERLENVEQLSESQIGSDDLENM